MAEIRIEKKKPVWPWVLIILLILAAVAAFYFMGDDDEDAVMTDTREEQSHEEQRLAADTTTDYGDDTMGDDSDDLQEFREHLKQENGRMGKDHEYTQRSFVLLADAMEETAERRNYNIEADLEEVENWADQITKDPSSMEHADKINQGFDRVIKAFKNMQQAKFPNMKNDISKLEEYNKNLKSGQPTLDQKKQVKGFFNSAAKLLEKMNNKSTNNQNAQ